jgi:hypothetical protein
MKHHLGVLLLLCLSWLAQAAPPNLLLIIADDCTYRDLGVYGGQAKTPHLDRLAAEGMKFTRCFQAAPMCSPTRHCLYTGLYPVKSVLVLSEQGNSFPFAKWTCYDAGLQSGCIARWPGRVKRGAVRDARYRYIRNLTPEATFQNAATKGPTFKTWEKMAAAGDAHAQRLVHDYQHRPAEELFDCEADPWNRT